MPSWTEMASSAKGTNRLMLTELEVDKLKHPETYKAVANFAERVQRYLLDTSGLDSLPPIPKD